MSSVRVATYTRISTDESNQPYSLEAQRERLTAYVASQPEWRIVVRYVDRASGKSLERPSLRAAREAAAAGAYDLLLTYRVDRLSRNLGQLAALVEELQGHGVAFRSATEPFDTANAAGKMLLQLLGAFAEFERASIIDRIGAGMERKAQRGEWNGGTYPFGYRRPDGGGGGLAVDPAAAPMVREMFRRYVEERVGARVIATWLNEQGIPTRYGGRWATQSVLAVLRNRIYLGEVSFRRVWYAGHHEPIVEAAVFEQAQAILAERSARPGLRRTNPTDFLLSGLPLVCDRCGHPMVGASARGHTGQRYAYYTCATRNRYGSTVCDQGRLPQQALEEAILGQMGEVYRDTTLVAAAIEQAQAQLRAGQAEQATVRTARQAEAADLRRRIERYFAAFETGELDPKQVRERVGALQARLAELEAELAAPAQPIVPATPVDAAEISWVLSEALAMVLRIVPAPRAKALLRLLIEEIRVVSPTDIRPAYRVPLEVRTPNELVSRERLELSTRGLRDRCSTVELPAHGRRL